MMPTAVSAAPNGNVLYVATASGPIVAYTIGTDGTPQVENGGKTLASVQDPTGMSMDRSGKLLFVISSSSPKLYIFQVDPANHTLHPAAAGAVASARAVWMPSLSMRAAGP